MQLDGILKGVSRSFYLTLRVAPRRVRHPRPARGALASRALPRSTPQRQWQLLPGPVMDSGLFRSIWHHFGELLSRLPFERMLRSSPKN